MAKRVANRRSPAEGWVGRVALKLLVFAAGGAGEHELLIPVGHCGTLRIVCSAIPTIHNILRCRAGLFVSTKTYLRKTEARQRRRRTRWRGYNTTLIVKTPLLSNILVFGVE